MSLNSIISSDENYIQTFNDTLLIYTSIELNKLKITFKNVKQNEIIGNLVLDSDLSLTCLEYVNNSNELALIGLSNGNVIVYSILDSKVINTFNVSKQKITCLNKGAENLVFCLDSANVLYVADYFTSVVTRKNDLTVFVNNSNGTNETITNLIALSDVDFLLTTQSIKHVNIEKEEVVSTFPGHLTYIKEIQLLKVDDQTIFYTFSNEDKFVNFYNLKENGRLMFVLSCNENVKEVKYKYDDAEKVKVITVITQEGNLEIFNSPFSNSSTEDASSSKKRKKMNRISKKSDLQIKFQQLGAGLKVLQLIINNENNLTLFYKDGRKTTDNIIAEPFEYSYELKNHYKLEKVDVKAVDLRTLGEFINQSDEASKVSYKEKNNYVTQGDNFTTLEAQISEILNQDPKTTGSGNTFGDIAVNTKQAKNTDASKKKKVSNKKTHVVGTLTTILRQALKSNDHTLIDQVLNTKDPQVIKMTLWKLPATQAPDFLVRLTDKVIANTNNSSNNNNSIDLWLYYTLTIHGNYLMQFSNHIQLKSQLSNLYFIVSKKAGFYTKLDKLRSIVESQLTRNYVFEEQEMINAQNDDYLIVDGEEYLESDYEYDENLDVDENEDDDDADYSSDAESENEGLELDAENETGFDIDQDVIPLETNQVSDVEMESE